MKPLANSRHVDTRAHAHIYPWNSPEFLPTCVKHTGNGHEAHPFVFLPSVLWVCLFIITLAVCLFPPAEATTLPFRLPLPTPFVSALLLKAVVCVCVCMAPPPPPPPAGPPLPCAGRFVHMHFTWHEIGSWGLNTGAVSLETARGTRMGPQFSFSTERLTHEMSSHFNEMIW